MYSAAPRRRTGQVEDSQRGEARHGRRHRVQCIVAQVQRGQARQHGDLGGQRRQQVAAQVEVAQLAQQPDLLRPPGPVE